MAQIERIFYFGRVNREVSSRVDDGVRSAAVVVDRRRPLARVRVPEWATIARVRLVGGCSASGAPGDAVDGVMSVRAGTSLRIVLGAAGTEEHPDGGATSIVRDGIAVACAAGAAAVRARGSSRPGPLWDVRVRPAELAECGSVEFEFIGPDGRASEVHSIDGVDVAAS